MKLLFPDGRKKAFTLSYDDGIKQDIRLIEIFNKYNLKATFNLNSGLLDDNNPWITKGVVVPQLNSNQVSRVYKGHEIACHGLTHPNLAYEDIEEIRKQIVTDKKNLEELLSYKVKGMAYPFGGYDDRVIKVMKSQGIKYGRTVIASNNFELQDDFYRWKPTCHHNFPEIMHLAQLFIENDFKEASIFYVWGHSYEFDVDNNWNHIERFSKKIGNCKDIWYATNIEIVDYINAYNNLIVLENDMCILNNSNITIYIENNGHINVIAPGETIIS